MFTPRFMPCPDCGSSVDFAYAEEHVCPPAQSQTERPLVTVQDDADPAASAAATASEAVSSADVEAELQRYLETAAGRFESWLAALQVRAAG
jgi:hypothetical protein